MKMKSYLLALALLCAASTAFSATIITVGNLATDGSNIDNANVLYAYSIAAPTETLTYAVNGVNFAPIAIAATGPSPYTVNYSTTDYAFTLASSSTASSFSFESGGTGATANPAPTTGNLANVLSGLLSGAGASSQNSDARLTLKGLTSGMDYKIQLLLATSSTSNRVFNINAGAETEPVTLNSSTLPAQLATITFTATGTSFDVGLDATSGRVSLNGFVVSAVPEPSAAAFLALGGFLALIRRRRRR